MALQYLEVRKTQMLFQLMSTEKLLNPLLLTTSVDAYAVHTDASIRYDADADRIQAELDSKTCTVSPPPAKPYSDYCGSNLANAECLHGTTHGLSAEAIPGAMSGMLGWLEQHPSERARLFTVSSGHPADPHVLIPLNVCRGFHLVFSWMGHLCGQEKKGGLGGVAFYSFSWNVQQM